MYIYIYRRWAMNLQTHTRMYFGKFTHINVKYIREDMVANTIQKYIPLMCHKISIYLSIMLLPLPLLQKLLLLLVLPHTPMYSICHLFKCNHSSSTVKNKWCSFTLYRWLYMPVYVFLCSCPIAGKTGATTLSYF